MTTLRQGDEFVLWRREDGRDDYRVMRVLVGPPGAETLTIPLGMEPDVRPFPEPWLMVMSPESAQALMERTRGGGTAEDDAP